MRIGLYGATVAVGSALLIHLLKGNDLQPGDTLVLIGRGTKTSTAKMLAMCSDLLDAFDAGVIELKVCNCLEDLDELDVFVMAAGATISRKITNRSGLAELNVSLFENVAKQLHSRCSSALVLVISNPVLTGDN